MCGYTNVQKALVIDLTNAAPRSLLARRQQRSIAAGRGGVDRDHLLIRESLEIIRAACLGPGSGETSAAEGLRADHRPDHVAVDVDIAVGEPRDDMLDRRINAGM